MSLTRGTASFSPLHESAAFGVGDDQLHGGDGQALADAAALVDLLVFACGEGDLLDDCADVVRESRCDAAARSRPGFLRGDGDAFFERLGIVGANLGADAVLERRDDLAARGVVLGVGAEDEGDVEREADGVALNLHVAFLHDVEERDLDFAGEVGQLVDGEDAAVGAGQQAVVHGEFAGEILAAARGLDGVEVADEVGHGDVGRGELFDVAVVAADPGDGGGVAALGDEVAAALAERVVGVVANFAAGDVGHVFVEQRGERAEDAALGLAAQAEQDEVLPGENGVDDLRDDRVFVADDAGEERLVRLQAGDEVRAQFILDVAGLEASFRKLSAAAQFPQRIGEEGELASNGSCSGPTEPVCV